MFDYIILVFLLICYICLALITSAIFTLDIGLTLSTAEIIVYTNSLFQSLATFALVFTLTKKLLLSLTIVLIYLLLKHFPLKKKKNCSNRREDLGKDKSCYKINKSINIRELIIGRE